MKSSVHLKVALEKVFLVCLSQYIKGFLFYLFFEPVARTFLNSQRNSKPLLLLCFRVGQLPWWLGIFKVSGTLTSENQKSRHVHWSIVSAYLHKGTLRLKIAIMQMYINYVLFLFCSTVLFTSKKWRFSMLLGLHIFSGESFIIDT